MSEAATAKLKFPSFQIFHFAAGLSTLGRQEENPTLYINPNGAKTRMNKYRGKLHVSIAPQDLTDRRTRNIISITFVRLVQNGNISVKQEIMGPFIHTISD